MIRLIAPDSLSTATRSAIAETKGVKRSRCSWLRRNSRGGKYEPISPPFSQINRPGLSGVGLAPGFSCPRRRSPAKGQRQGDGRGLSARRHGWPERGYPVQRSRLLYIETEHRHPGARLRRRPSHRPRRFLRTSSGAGAAQEHLRQRPFGDHSCGRITRQHALPFRCPGLYGNRHSRD